MYFSIKIMQNIVLKHNKEKLLKSKQFSLILNFECKIVKIIYNAKVILT